MVTCTSHAMERFGERMNIYSEKVALNNADRAWRNGKTPNEYSGQAHRFLENKEKRYNDSTRVRVFRGFCFIFEDQGLLKTMYEAPFWVLNSNRRKRPRFRGEDYIHASDCEDIYFKLNMYGHIVSFFYSEVVV